jgi:hypothetical protein
MKVAFSAIVALCAGALMATSSAASASSLSGSSARSYTYARHYVNGQVSHYTYTEDESGTELTAAARLRSYVRRGIGGEQVKWVALSSAGQNLDAQARAFPPYDLSLDPADPDGLALPNTLTAGKLQGPIDDLNTFYVGLSAHVGIDNLHQSGQSYVDPTLLSGNFSNATTPVGQDLIQLTTTLTGLSAREATFTSSYQPPAGGGLTLSQSWMNSPVCGSTPNNFEDVQEEGTAYIALWGCERFTITTVVDRVGGQIISVQMSNPLQLNSTVCQDEALTECSPISPLAVPRTVQLARD